MIDILAAIFEALDRFNAWADERISSLEIRIQRRAREIREAREKKGQR